MKKHLFDYMGYVLLVISSVLIIVGVLKGEHTDVFQKAIKICLECIGIG